MSSGAARLVAVLLAAHAGCGGAPPAEGAPGEPGDATGWEAGDRPRDPRPAPARFVLRGGALPGGRRADVEVSDGRISAVGAVASGLPEFDATGRFLAPAFVDSHVHLAYDPRAREMAAGGVAAAVDQAAPESFFTSSFAPLRVIGSGPMVTAPGGYPTRGWGSGGYGLECADAAEAAAAVDRLKALGAGLIKLPVTAEPQLDDAALAAAADRAHALSLKVSSHALGDADAVRAARAGADVLAHTPVEPLGEEALEAWRGRAVVSTLEAFGGGAAAVGNLAALRARGATVLYGTDFGNTREPGIDPDELALLAKAGLDGAAVLAAGTSAPAAFWGLEDLGAIEPGRAASLLVLDADPHRDPSTLARPLAVFLDGVRVSP